MYITDAVPQRAAVHALDAAPSAAEFGAALKALKAGKASGADGIVAELIKLGGEVFHGRLLDLVLACWERGAVPAAWRDAVMVPLPKAKGDIRLCDSWRGISLLSVLGKVLAKIVAARLGGFAEGLLTESSNGFRPGRGTTDCIALVRALIDRACNSDGSLHCVFIDLRKCFDRVHRQGLWLTLQRQGVPPKLLSVCRALHDGMEARVRVDGSLSEPFPVRTGVRQGCLIAPVLLNLFYAAVLAEWRRLAPTDITIRFAVDAKLTNCNRTFRAADRSHIGDTVYADDTTLLSSSWETAKAQWHRYIDTVGKFGLTIAFAKTKALVAGNDDSGGMLLAQEERHQDELGPWACIERVTSFNMLGSHVQSDGGYESEVAHRLRSAGGAWARLKPTCFSGRLLGPRRKFALFRVFVLSRLLYGAEVWCLRRRQVLRLRKFYNACHRSMAGFNRWTQHARHVTDTRIREMLGAPPLEELLDRSDSSSESGSEASGSAGDNAADGWPQASEFTSYHRSRHVLRCNQCSYRTHVAPWLDAH
eukprot:gene15280-6738_t